MHRKTVRLDARVRPSPPGEPREGRAERDERYRVLLDAGELVVLRRDGAGATDDGGRVLMAGEVLSPSTVLEVINLIASSRWVGTLQVFAADSHRTLGFARGVLRHAKSDHPEDRLDKVLCRSGALSPFEVESAMRDIRPDQRLGEVLLQRRVISRQQLFTHLEKQMEEILLAAVLEETGCYLFTVDDEPDPPPPTTVHIPVQHLILTAAERVDTMSQYRRLIPDFEMCPEVEPGVEVTRLDADSRLVVGYCTGRRSVREIAGETWLGRYHTAAVLYRLLRDGRVHLAPPRRTPREEATRLVAPYNELLREIHDAIDTWGDRRRARREVAAWIADDPDRELLRAAVDGDGLVDPTAVAEALVEPTSDQQLDALRHVLTELTAYALFTASLWLPREVERDLARRVNERLQRAG